MKEQQLGAIGMAFEVARVHSQLCTSLSPTWAFAGRGQQGFSGSEWYSAFGDSFYSSPSARLWTNSHPVSASFWKQGDGSEAESEDDPNETYPEGMAELVAQLALGDDEDSKDDGGLETGDSSETDDSSLAFTSDSASKGDATSAYSESCSSEGSPTLAAGSESLHAWDKFMATEVSLPQTTVHYNMEESHARLASLNLAHQQMLMQNFIAAERSSRSMTEEGRTALLDRLRALQETLTEPRHTKLEKKMPAVVMYNGQQATNGRRGKKDARRVAASDCAKQEKKMSTQKNSSKGGGSRNSHQKGRNGKNSSVQGKSRNGDKQWAGGIGGNSGLRAIFLKAGGSASPETPGTGVFLPRVIGGHSDPRKKPACATVLLPSRVYDVLKLHENPHVTRTPFALPIATPRASHADKPAAVPSLTPRGVATVTVKPPPTVVYREQPRTPVVCRSTMYSTETDSNRLPTEWSY